MSFYLKNNDYDLFDNNFMSNFMKNSFFESNKGLLKTDIEEKDNSYELSVEVPGYNKDQITLSIEKGYLKVVTKVEKINENDKNEKKTKNYIRRERFYGSCSRTFYIGEEYNESNIKASFNNGILLITLPKEVEQPKVEKKNILIE